MDTQRRELLRAVCRGTAVIGIVGAAGFLAVKKQTSTDATVWQIDPNRCIGCGGCAYRCVLTVSAVKCFHNFAMCGYCDLCTGFFDPQPIARHAGGENQLCPVGAIFRRAIEPPYFEYDIDEDLCIGCGKCVDGCVSLGNGSLFLQINQKLCKQCNQCSIALHCPSEAIHKVPASQPYRLKQD